MRIVPVDNYGAGFLPKKYEPIRVDGLMTIDERGGEITFHHDGADSARVRAFITDMGRRLLALSGQHVDMPVTHECVDGMYIRRLFIPKGTLIVGRVHKLSCINVVEQGDISILTESGSKRVQSGFLIASPAGLQKVGFAHEDTVFTNVFRTDETDPDKLEDIIACDSHDEWLAVSSDTLIIEGVTLCQQH